MASQPDYGSHIAEQLKRLRAAQPNFSAADSELFDIHRIEEQTRDALERNRQLNEQLRHVQQEEIQREAEISGKEKRSNLCSGRDERRCL